MTCCLSGRPWRHRRKPRYGESASIDDSRRKGRWPSRRAPAQRGVTRRCHRGGAACWHCCLFSGGSVSSRGRRAIHATSAGARGLQGIEGAELLASPGDALEGADEDNARTVPGGGVRVRRNPDRADGVGVEGVLVPRLVPSIGAQAGKACSPMPRRSRLRSHRGVKTTRGAVSRIGPPAIHAGLSVHPLARWCLAASRPGCPLPDEPHRSWRPPAPRPWCGVAPSVFSHPRPCLPRVACLFHSWVCPFDLQVRVTGKARLFGHPQRRA